MDKARCRWCGGEDLVWSHETGYVVCASCGAVLGDIMDESPMAGPMVRASRPLPRRGLGPAEEKVLEAARRGLLVRATRRGLVLDHPGNEAARRLLREMRELRQAYQAVLEDPLLKSRTLRARVGLALYIHLVAQGTPKRRALSEAAARAGTSPYTLQSIIRRYRSRVDNIIARIRDASG